MEGESYGDDLTRKRTALGDVSNTNGKRSTPLTSGKFVIGDQLAKNVDSGTDNGGSSKRVCKSSERVLKEDSGFHRYGIDNHENCKPSFFSEYKKDWQNIRLSTTNGKQIFQSAVSCYNNEERKGSELPYTLNPGRHFIRGNISSNITSARQHKDDQNRTGGYFENDQTIWHADAKKSFNVDNMNQKESEADFCNLSAFTSCNSKCASEQQNNAIAGGIRILNQESSNRSCIDASSSQPSELPGLMGSNNAGVHRKPNIYGNPPLPDADVEPVCSKDCSCSLCLQAAYIWADLLYQDAIGRLTEVKKSKRQASMLVRKSCVREVHGSNENDEKFRKFTSMECDLMNRWRSLFERTENILQCEGTELQEDVHRLRKMRADCKRESETSLGNISSDLPRVTDDSC